VLLLKIGMAFSSVCSIIWHVVNWKDVPFLHLSGRTEEVYRRYMLG